MRLTAVAGVRPLEHNYAARGYFKLLMPKMRRPIGEGLHRGALDSIALV